MEDSTFVDVISVSQGHGNIAVLSRSGPCPHWSCLELERKTSTSSFPEKNLELKKLPNIQNCPQSYETELRFQNSNG